MLIKKGARGPSGTGRGEKGCIYILEDLELAGYVKIGRTTKDSGTRKKQIERCGHIKFEPAEDQHLTKVFCYKRLEEILKTDLWNERCLYRCPSCKRLSSTPSKKDSDQTTKHGEWFKIDKQEAVERVEQ